MLGELVPLVLVPAAALALAIRVPGQVSHGKAPAGPQVQQALTALALLVGACWLALLAGPALSRTDLGGFAVALLVLPLTVAVAYVMQPQQLAPAMPLPAPARVAPKASPEPQPQSEIQTAEPESRKQSDIETLVFPKKDVPAGPRAITQPEILGAAASESAAIARIIEGLGDRPAVVFSPYAEAEANQLVHRIAAHLGARRYMSLPPEENATDAEHKDAAHEAAGPSAGHASELALDLAGGAITSLLLVDDRIELSALAISGLERIDATVLCGPSETPVIAACKVRVPLGAGNDERTKFLERLADELGAEEPKDDPFPVQPSAGVPAGLFDMPSSPLAAPIAPPPAGSGAPIVPPLASLGAPLTAPPVVSAPAGEKKATGLTGLFAAVGTPTPSTPAPMPLMSAPKPSAPKVDTADSEDETAGKSEEEE